MNANDVIGTARKVRPRVTQERLRELLDYDVSTGVFTWRQKRGARAMAGATAGTVNTTTGYRDIVVDYGRYQAHRLAWMYVHGLWPAAEIDHINGIKSDNRIDNLREATHGENAQNRGRRPDNTSGFKGVSWCKRARRWRASIQLDSKQRHLGYFDCQKNASRAYAEAAKRLHGEFANTGN